MTDRYLSDIAKLHVCEALMYLIDGKPANLEEYASKRRVSLDTLNNYLTITEASDYKAIAALPDELFPTYIELKELVQLEDYSLADTPKVKLGLEALRNERDFIAEKSRYK